MTLKRDLWDLSPVRLSVLAAKSVDYNTAPQHLQSIEKVSATQIESIENFQLENSLSKQLVSIWVVIAFRSL